MPWTIRFDFSIYCCSDGIMVPSLLSFRTSSVVIALTFYRMVDKFCILCFCYHCCVVFCYCVVLSIVVFSFSVVVRLVVFSLYCFATLVIGFGSMTYVIFAALVVGFEAL